ncbi:MAG: enoyl-CoA hydratase [Robiginitomaculum sp.]|nr:MAG: enoyl-CoA hydratase [Robiginitomaculum sp.]
MSDTPYRLIQDGPIARLTLTRPSKRNALNAAYWRDLPGCISDLSAAGKTRVLILDAQGPHFCAGIDLGMFADMSGSTDEAETREAFTYILQRMQSGFDALEAARFPVIAAIQGCCIGAGVDMTSACDIRIATQDAYFRIEEINVGMMADVGTLQRLPKVLPLGVVRELAFTGATLDAKRAFALGFVNALGDDHGAVLALADEMATQIAAKPPIAIAASKDCINHARDHGVAESMRYMRAVQAGVFKPTDILSAVTARAEGKQADFADLINTNKSS